MFIHLKRFKFHLMIFCFLWITLYISSFFGDVLQVNNDEMYPNFEVGELLWLSPKSEYQLGDVVLIENSKNSNQETQKQYRLSRVIGMPKDQIEIKAGEVFRNGQSLRVSKQILFQAKDEQKQIWWEKIAQKTYAVLGKNLLVFWQGDHPAQVVTPEHYFIVCDQRIRCLQDTHLIPKDKIIGKVELRLFKFEWFQNQKQDHQKSYTLIDPKIQKQP